MANYPDRVNKYNHTPRKVFDNWIDKLERKIWTIRDDLRILEGRINTWAHDEDSLAERMDELEYMVRIQLQRKEDRE